MRAAPLEENGSIHQAQPLRVPEPWQIAEPGEGWTSVFSRGRALADSLWQDVRYSLRLLRKNPLATAVAVATLSLGIGATTSIFSLIHGVLLRPLPYAESDRIALVGRTLSTGAIDPDTTAEKYLAWKSRQSTLQVVAAALDTRQVTLESHDRPERIRQRPVTADFFRVLRLQPAAGRLFVPEDDIPGAAPTAVLSHGLWARAFGKDPAVIGRPLLLDGRSYTTVGVAPAGVDSTLAADLWTSFDAAGDPLGSGDNLMVLARLQEGVSLDQARADLRRVAGDLHTDRPEIMAKGETIAVDPYQERAVQGARPGLLILMGAVGLILLIACSNVANLSMARLAERRHELAVRATLGGGKGRIAWQLLTESLCLSLLSSIVGIGLAWLLVGLAVRYRPVDLPRLDEVTLDGRVLLFTLGLAVLTALLFGVVPALQAASRRRLETTLRGAGARGGTAGPGQERLSHAVVVVELALAAVLLIGASLLVRSLVNLWRVDPGFGVERVATFQTVLRGPRYATAIQVEGLAERVGTGLTGVRDVALCACLPLGGTLRLPLHSVDGRPKPPDRYLDTVQWMPITQDFFRVLEIPLRTGRVFGREDAASSVPVAIVNETFARKHFPEGGALGRRILLGWDMLGPEYEEGWREIVGVVGDIHESSLQAPPKPAVFVPFAQLKDPAVAITAKLPATFLVRTEGSRIPGQEEVRAALRTADPSLPVEPVRSMRQVVRDSLRSQRFQAFLLSAFALMATLLVTLGVFGVVSHGVARRTREIGIRMALGASRGGVIRSILGRSLGLAGLGLAIGIPGALALSRLLETFLFGVEANDPLVFLIVPALLCIVALLASYLPARSAAGTDAMVAMRHQ